MTTAVDGTGGSRRSVRWPPREDRTALIAQFAVFLAAVVARLVPPLAGGGLGGNYGYDAGVYFSSSDAFIHGRLPYQDFTLLHPPLLMLVLTPVALLARFTTDQGAFIVGNLGFTVLGGINAVLVSRVARRAGFGFLPAVVAGAFYALWHSSVQAEGLMRLEPLGNFFLLLALHALLLSQETTARRWPLLCGLALGAACSVKIWWALPLVLILAWQIVGDVHRRRRAPRAVGGAALALIAVNGPFFLVAPSQMLHQVVLDQFGRPYQRPGPVVRVRQLLGIGRLVPAGLVTPVVVLAIVLIAVACLRAYRAPFGRPLLVLTALELAVVLAAPHWSGYYGDFLAPTVALIAGASVVPAAALSPNPLGRLRLPTIAVNPRAPTSVAAVVLVALAWISVTAHAGTKFPGRTLARSVTGLHCVMADSNMALINLDVLTRDLNNGCPNWVDVSGRTYGIDAVRRPDGRFYSRPLNPVWQRDLTRYLLSGDAVVVVRAASGISATTLKRLRQGGRIACAHKHCVYRVNQPAH